MPVDLTLAQLSNELVYASMAAYACALVAFAACLAARPGRALEPAAAPAGALAAQGEGGVGTLTRVTSGPPAPPAPPASPGRRAGNIGLALTWLATLLLGGGVLLRGLSVSRPPFGNMYEFSIASALAISAAFLVLSLRRDLRFLGLFVTLPVLLTLGLAITVLYTDAEQLMPALQSYWLVIHVTLATICGGALCVAAALTVLYLVVDVGERRTRAGRAFRLAPLVDRLPSAARLDALSYRVTAFTFPLWTFTIIAGAIWAEAAWSRYWGWDPKEVWAFITWVAYAAYLHARATAGWKGRRAAYLGLVAFACFLFNYYGVNIFFSGLHSYSGL